MSYDLREYAECFSDLGDIYPLKHSKVFCLKLANAYSPHLDLTCCYPFFTPSSIDNLITDLIPEKNFQCFYGVLNPWVKIEKSDNFFDVFFKYKEHYFIDLSCANLWEKLGSTHKRKVKKSLSSVEIRISTPREVCEEWPYLYENLIKKHDIRGFTKFSASILKNFIFVPGAVIFSAYKNESICGVAIFYESPDITYYHLAAYSEQGYNHSASYGLFWEAINYFRSKSSILHLGGVPDSPNRGGLEFFKKGWGSKFIPCYFLGKILNIDKFNETIKISNSQGIKFFPPYQANRFQAATK